MTTRWQWGLKTLNMLSMFVKIARLTQVYDRYIMIYHDFFQGLDRVNSHLFSLGGAAPCSFRGTPLGRSSWNDQLFWRMKKRTPAETTRRLHRIFHHVQDGLKPMISTRKFLGEFLVNSHSHSGRRNAKTQCHKAKASQDPLKTGPQLREG